ncbi:TonB-dependent receptor [Rhabdobacter roseus]|uniref:TonB-linked SusC/RagA family outer membrane protein n=1 Tax=Rhabdobacter roseus TaxID=1655419 RepID=A0A840U0M3_9BACT|nr:TonB-dependent receptor [Rhabdobacter roseus]MBB5285690.1 TonB-linked SusC/RagA family outer membrane protein [Rhabdobacter roseus]
MKTKIYWVFRSTILVLLITVAFQELALGQARRVTGRVIGSSDQQAVPGATVVVKGTQTGTSTDSEGNFAISVQSENDVLVFSFVGYQSTEVTVGNQSTINITLNDDISNLEEVIVTGYSVDSRRETTGAVSTVKSKDLTVTPSGNVEQQLQGRVAGVTVITNGQPGTASQIRVRGFGAFGGNNPLYIVDGVPTDNTDFLSPDDIESTTVLKDAAAASIYGARAANGVIVYTTKKGLKGAKKLSITYDGMYGLTDPGRGQDMLNPTEFAQWTWMAEKHAAMQEGRQPDYQHPQFGNGTTPVIPDFLRVGSRSGVTGNVDLAAERERYNVNPDAGAVYQVIRANKQGTDWYDAITRVAPLMRHTLGFSGGGENSRYYISFSAQDQQGILLNNSFKRYTIRTNSEFDILKNLRFGENIQFTYRSVLGQGGAANGQGVAADENDILQAFRMPSIIPVYDEFGGYAGTVAAGFNNPRNPVANRDGLINNRGFGINGFGNLYLEFEPIEGLTLRSSVAGGVGNFYNWGYTRRQYENSENNSAFSYNEGAGYGFGWTLTNTAAYKKRFDLHGVEVLVGQEALNTGAGRNMSGNGINPFSQDINYVNLNTVGSRQVGSGLGRGVNFSSLFARANYIYNDKYILTGVIRRDGSSRFGVNNRYGVFPAFSAAWRVSSEEFMKGIPWITDLKIRGGYGLMGNSNNVDPNNQYSLYGTNLGESVYDINGTNSSVAEGYYRTRIGNPNAKWETSVTKNIGIDGTFYNGKLDIIVDFWQKDTRDLLFQVPITATAGYRAAAPSVNVGEMQNKGIDLQIINKGKFTSDLGYELNATVTLLDNKIVSLAPGLDYLTTVNPGFRGIFPIRNQIGYSLSSFYGYQVLGLFQSQAEIDAAPFQEGVTRTQDANEENVPNGVGRFRYADINGDGKIDADDRTYLGSPVPKFTTGFNFTLNYKNFDLVTYLYASIGNKIFNQSKWFTDFYPSFSGAAISARVKDSWTPENTNTDHPIFEKASNFSTNTQANSWYVEDGSYLRLQNITLGYTLPRNLLNKARMTKLRVFVSTNNLFTITKYSGLDPAVGGNADTNFGIDVGNYPMTRSFTAGLNLGF